MSAIDLLRIYCLVGVPVGLALGMALGLVARHDDGWGGYGSFRRRAARLGHIAAVMLPALAGLYALLLTGRPSDDGAARAAAYLWVAGGVLLPLALFAAAFRRRFVAAVPLPAAAVLAGGVSFAVALIRP